MASKKTNLRSFRYSDEVAAVLEQQEGKSLNDKFENLILKCYYEAPKWDKYVADMREQYQEERRKLFAFKDKLEDFRHLFSTLEQSERLLQTVVRLANNIADVTQD